MTEPLTYLSVASGISAQTLAWRPFGWRAVAFAQHDPDHNYEKSGPDFASVVLAHHYPEVPNLGDMTKFEEWPDADVDVLSGGTPCQTYSVAGLGAGLDDPRGDLALTYAAIARRYRPSWVVWENVGGVLSNDRGRSFASILGLLSGRRVEVPSGGWRSAGVVPGIARAYGLAWRVLDSEYVRVDGFGRAVPQRRRRVFVVGHLGDWRRAAAVLFERESLCGDPPPRRASGQAVAGAITRSFGVRGGVDEGDRGTLIPEASYPLNAHGGPHGRLEPTSQTFIPMIAATLTSGKNGTGGHRFPGMTADDAGLSLIPIALNAYPIAFDCKAGGDTGFAIGDVPGPLRGEGHGGGHAAIAFQPRFVRNGRGGPIEEVAYPLTAQAGETGKGDSATVVAYSLRSDASRDGRAKMPSADAEGRVRLRDPGFSVLEEVAPTLDTGAAHTVATGWSVRRLMPVECERLQGIPDDFTNVTHRGKPAADGQRYQVLGNAQSVNVMRWIGRRIDMVRSIP